MKDYISPGKGKVVRIKFPNLGHILELEPLSQRLMLVLRVAIVGINNGIEFEWDDKVHASDETVNIELNEIVSRNPTVQISFSDK